MLRATRTLRTSHAFHSPMMEAALAPFEAVLRDVTLHPPAVQVVSNLTGTWLTAEQATDPRYWSQHLRHTVQFHACLATLLQTPRRVLLEVGPGKTLTALAGRHDCVAADHLVAASCRHPKQHANDLSSILQTVGQLWARGVAVDWQKFGGGIERRRVPLPAYPFERERHWLGDLLGNDKARARKASPAEPQQRRTDVSDFVYLPSWRELDHAVDLSSLGAESRRWLICGDNAQAAAPLLRRLRDLSQQVTAVAPLPADPNAATSAVHAALTELDGPPQVVVDLCGLFANGQDVMAEATASTLRVLHLAKSIAGWGGRSRVTLLEITSSLQSVSDEVSTGLGRAAAAAAARVAARELPRLTCRAVDLAAVEEEPLPPAALDRLVREALIETDEPVVAYRGLRRFVRHVEPVRLPPVQTSRLIENGCYLITGGLGGIGLALAEALAERCRAKLVLLGRTPLHSGEQADPAAQADPHVRSRLEAISRIERFGGKVVAVTGNVADVSDVRRAVGTAIERFGRIDGIIHAAGIAPGGALTRRADGEVTAVLAPKIAGAVALQDAVATLDPQPGFIAYCSSLASFIGVPGQIDYSAANAVLDAIARASNPSAAPRVLGINWDAWSETGMAARMERAKGLGRFQEESLAQGLRTSEGIELFFRALASPWPQILTSTRPLAPRLGIDAFAPDRRAEPLGDVSPPLQPSSPQAPADDRPTTSVVDRVAQVWREFLGARQSNLADDFFELGGHSLLAVQMVHRLQEMYGVELSPDALFQSPTLGGFAAHIEQLIAALAPAAGPSVAAPVADDGAKLLDAIESLTDEQVQAMLDKELAIAPRR